MKRALAPLLALLAGALLAPPVQATPVLAAPTPLPADRLHFGLSNLDVSWMTGSGVPWRYRFQYLAGGVNTGSGWETWQDPADPPGQFAVDYMAGSTSGSANYIPVFTYYELLQSTPSTGADEGARDFSNLNNAATMNAYYANFKLLMQRAGAYGGQVVIHVEPDFWGYMQQHAAGGGASAVAAKVKSSGFAEAAAYADNLVGFTSELKFLRDTYAPNALLAMHASMWSSGFDVATNTSPTLNASAEADKTAAFLNSAGMWDLVFNDVDDHNAAWWELASCGSPPCVNQYYTHWWDTANVKFPNFSRYLAWVAELHAKTARPQVVWQVPMGNQYYLTMNNTCGHYQDNVGPYFIAHPNDLFNAGLIAVLFGPANSCQTENEDGRADGITNNSGQPTTDTLGGCSACNTHTSVYADDDGGYLRTFVRAYYTACTSASLAPSLSPPRPSGTSITFTPVETGCSGQHKFWLLPPGGAWRVVQNYGVAGTWTWHTAGYAPGTYEVGAWEGSSSSPSRYESYAITSFTLGVVGCTSASLGSDVASPQALGTTVNFTGSSTRCAAPQYQFWLLAPGGTWTMKRAYGAASWAWNTTSLAPGTYQVGVWARQAGSTASYDAYFITTYQLSG